MNRREFLKEYGSSMAMALPLAGAGAVTIHSAFNAMNPDPGAEPGQQTKDAINAGVGAVGTAAGAAYAAGYDNLGQVIWGKDWEPDGEDEEEPAVDDEYDPEDDR